MHFNFHRRKHCLTSVGGGDVTHTVAIQHFSNGKLGRIDVTEIRNLSVQYYLRLCDVF